MHTLAKTLDWDGFTHHEKPFFIYFENLLGNRLQKLQALFAGVPVFYSVKSNPNIQVIRWLDSMLAGFDISSEAELRMLLNIGISPDRITFSGPGKTDSALQLASKKKIKAIHIDSLSELEFLQQQGSRTSWTLRVAGSQTIAAKLGFNDVELSAVLAKQDVEAFSGLHCYLGRESFNEKLFTDTYEKLTSLFAKYPKAFTLTPQVYIGPGLPSSFDSGNLLGETSNPYPMNFEIGRSLIAPCGFYGVQVLARKTTDSGREIVIVEGGLQHLGSPIQSFRDNQVSLNALLIRKGKVIDSEDLKPMSIYGSLCLWHDCLVAHIELPNTIQRGDWLIFANAGAYGLTAGVPFFIGQNLPKEFAVDKQGISHDVTNTHFKSYLETTI